MQLKDFEKLKGNIYINSLESSDIYEAMLGRPINSNFVGMIPYSLESVKLRELGLKVYEDKNGKLRTKDIINVKFNNSVKDYKSVLKKINIQDLEKRIVEKAEELNNLKTKPEKKKSEYYISRTIQLITYLKRIEQEETPSLTRSELRKKLYKEGFTLDGIEYVVYKRTSAKSRTGQVQFIKKSLYDKAMNWCRLDLDINEENSGNIVEYPSLLSYESLVGSAIIDVIQIKPENILIVSDVLSKFHTKAKVVKSNGKSEGLISEYVDNYEMQSDIFDGESLLDESYFKLKDKNYKGSMLLRNHMFKTCAFNTKLEKFLRDNVPKDVDFEEWKLKDMFGNELYAKDVKMITTPNSLKVLKFYKLKNTKQGMVEHWFDKIREDDCVFGICKYEKESKRGYDDNNNILNRTSYQMINSMPLTHDDIKEISEFEIEYINRLKNDDKTYIEFLKSNANEMNTNDMLVDIYHVNKNIVNTSVFKNKRKKDVYNYINNVKRGRVRLKGDYCVICQNPKELLYHSIGKLPIKDGLLDYEKWKPNMELIYNQAFIPLHKFDKEYPSFRNPHTSPSNVMILENKKSEFIEKYMNYTKNIVITNAIGIEINRRLSGQDVDSDTLIIFDNDKIRNVGKYCYNTYSVCENKTPSIKSTYKINNISMYKIDDILSSSQYNIGKVVNLGQLAMSMYWDNINNNGDKEKREELLKLVDVCTILSEISIDMAKKLYKININKEIDKITKILYENRNEESLDYFEKDNKSKSKGKLQVKKPLFFTNISRVKLDKTKTRFYNTSMDYLFVYMEYIKQGKINSQANKFISILKKKDFKIENKNINQKNKIDIIINDYIKSRKKIYLEYQNKKSENDREEMYRLLDDVYMECRRKLSKYKISKETLYYAIYKVLKDENSKGNKSQDILNYLDILYRIDRYAFLEMFA